MKKKRIFLIIIIIALLLVLGIVFFVNIFNKDNNIDSEKEDIDKVRSSLVETSPELYLDILWNSIETNKAKAKTDYEGNTYKIKVKVMNIQTNYFDYSIEYNNNIKTLRVCMSTEELAKLTAGDYITVLGTLTNISGTPRLLEAFDIEPYIQIKQYDEEKLKEIINNYGGSGNDGNISWKEGSYPFFIDNRLNFEKIDGNTFNTELTGEWTAKQYVDGDRNTFLISFTSENTANVSKNGSKGYEWKFSIRNNMLYFPESNNEAYEVRKVSENLLVFYAKTNNYVPYWILYK